VCGMFRRELNPLVPELFHDYRQSRCPVFGDVRHEWVKTFLFRQSYSRPCNDSIMLRRVRNCRRYYYYYYYPDIVQLAKGAGC